MEFENDFEAVQERARNHAETILRQGPSLTDASITDLPLIDQESHHPALPFGLNDA